MATPVATYAFINAKLRGRIGKLLDEDFFRGMAAAPSFTEAITALEATPYAPALDVYRRTGDLKQVEIEVLRRERSSLARVARFAPDRITPFIEALLRQYEVATVKHALRLYFEAAVLQRPIDDKVAYLDREGPIESSRLDAVVNAFSDGEVTAALSEQPYADAIEATLSKAREQRSVFGVEVALDRWCFTQLMEATQSLEDRDAKIALGLIRIQIDSHNLHWVVRMRRYTPTEGREPPGVLLSGGRLFSNQQLQRLRSDEHPDQTILSSLSGRYGEIDVADRGEEEGSVRRLALMEELLRHILFQEVRRVLGGYPFTIGIVLAYAFLLQNEVRLVISVLNAKYYEVSAARIEGLL